MKVKVKKRITVEDVVDVVFPLYVRDWDLFEASSYETITRIDANGAKWSVTERSDGRGRLEYEFDACNISVEHELPEYLEDSDQKPSSEAAFIKLVERAVAILATFPIKPEAVKP
jgi:hypothetical protein